MLRKHRVASKMIFIALFGVVIACVAIDKRQPLANQLLNQQELQQANEALRYDCGRAWDIAWRLAKGGNHEAQLFLFLSLAGDQLIPPAVDNLDPLILSRYDLILGAYGALAENSLPQTAQSKKQFEYIRRAVPTAIHRLGLGENGRKVAACYTNRSSFSSCLSLGLQLRVVPEFSDFSEYIEKRRRETGVGPRCRLAN